MGKLQADTFTILIQVDELVCGFEYFSNLKSLFIKMGFDYINFYVINLFHGIRYSLVKQVI